MVGPRTPSNEHERQEGRLDHRLQHRHRVCAHTPLRLASELTSTTNSAALASTFAEQGCTVYASARKLDALGSLSPEIKRLALDVVDFEQCKDAVEFIVGAEGKIDVRGLVSATVGGA